MLGSLLEPDARGQAPFGAHITADIVAELEKIGPEIAKAWGFQTASTAGWAAELWTVADKAVETTFRFLDLLGLLVLRNPLPEDTSALLAGEVSATPARPVPGEGYDDYLPILFGFPLPHPEACLTGGLAGA
ncbi:hypothetical protein [Rhodococcus sp. A5(2022)]|uniref:hypothetical protein n=1 Tax=Rhodococcus sp. A5(2022) TaxID=3003588 RepID=UPI0022A87AB7|nr:hypothetical protein [Rhodococcus sp. A5(2022)]MCZ1075266.1 hypothetical protein [Rhodococcus sp. A5(2022)]